MLQKFFARQQQEFPWQARGSFEIELAKGFAKKKERFHVELFFQPPGMFRMDFLDPFGLTVASLLIGNTNVLFFDPSKDRAYVGPASDVSLQGTTLEGFTWLTFARLLIGRVGLAPQDPPEFSTTRSGVRMVWKAGRAEWFVGNCGQEPCEEGEIRSTKGDVLVLARYKEHFNVGSFSIARSARLYMANRHVRMHLWISSFRIPPGFDSSLFQLPIRNSTTVLRLKDFPLAELLP
jgi:hypothetical protein